MSNYLNVGMALTLEEASKPEFRRCHFVWPLQTQKTEVRQCELIEHLLTLEVPDKFLGKKVYIFVEVRAETGDGKSGWDFEGVSVIF